MQEISGNFRILSRNGDSDGPIIVRQLEPMDVDAVARVHLRSFREFFLSFLGLDFLKQYYLSIVKFSQFGLVAAHHRKVIGFIVGIDSSSGFYKKMLKSRGIRFAFSSLPAIVRKPSAIPRLVGAFWKRAPVEQDEVPTVHLTSLGVEPELFGCGIGHRLISEFLPFISQRGFKRIVLETDAENNERVRNFYTKEGFLVRRSFVTPQGRKMLEFEKNL